MSATGPGTLSVATLNVHGLSGRVDDVLRLVIAHDIDILFLCETWSGLGTRTPSETIIGFTPFPDKQHARGRNSCGTAFAVHPKWLGQLSDFVIDQTPNPGLTARVRFQGVTVCGIYLPPHDSLETCQRLIRGVIPEGCERPFMLLGDFNMRLGHRTGDTWKNPRGLNLSLWLEEQGLTLLESCHGVPTCWQGAHACSIVDYVWPPPRPLSTH
jgi:exonuclease III